MVNFFIDFFSVVQRGFLAALLFLILFFVPVPVHAQTDEFPISLQGVAESAVLPELYACVTSANNQYVSDAQVRYSEWLADATDCYKQYNKTGLLPPFLQTYDFSTATSDFALENCNADVQRGQYARIATCMWTPNKSTEQCYAEEKNTTIELLAACYRDQIPKDSIWRLPIMQKAIQAQLSGGDYNTLSLQTKFTLDTCLKNVLIGEQADTLDVQKQQGLVACYTQAGLKDIADFYTTSEIVVDCATEAAARHGLLDIKTFITSRSSEDESYIEQCVIKKTAPVILGLAAVNIPFAAGIANVFLYLQFLFTQPFLLLRGSRRNWGQVLDAMNGDPIDLSTVRLIDEEKKTILRSMVTNRKGEYFFLPPLGTYRVEASKQGYAFPSTLLKGDAQYYFGHTFTVDSKGDVVDKHIPLDPAVEAVSVRAFFIKKWRYRIATIFSAVGPLSTAVFFFFVPKWWVVILFLVHVILFFVFRRLSSQRKIKQFGIVKGKNGKPLSRVKVFLFNGPYKKLLHYYVTDVFGRYYFPPVVGSFLIRFEKERFDSVSRDVDISPDDEMKTLNIDVMLEDVTG